MTDSLRTPQLQSSADVRRQAQLAQVNLQTPRVIAMARELFNATTDKRKAQILAELAHSPNGLAQSDGASRDRLLTNYFILQARGMLMNRATPSAGDSLESSASKDYRVIQDLVSRYVGQLLYGCRDPNCRETLCDTGRRNTGHEPVRKYTPRSARAIALTVVSGPNPRSRLCLKYNLDTSSSRETTLEGRRDPTSLMQQLCDTASIRGLVDRLQEININRRGNDSVVERRTSYLDPALARWSDKRLRESGNEADPKEFHAWLPRFRELLDELSQSFSPDSGITLEEILEGNDRIRASLAFCLQWLLTNLPYGNPTQWQHVNMVISTGCAYPQNNQDIPYDSSYNNWLDLLDAFEHQPSFDLLCRLLAVLTERHAMEQRASRESPPHSIDTTLRVADIQERYLARQVINTVLDDESLMNKRPGLIVWLKKAFLRYWNGDIRVHNGSLPLISLKLLRYISEHALRGGVPLDTVDVLLQVPMVAFRLDAAELARTWLEGPSDGHLLNFGFLFSINQEATYFRTMNHLRMRKANSDSEIAEALRHKLIDQLEFALDPQGKYLEERYFLLNVSRSNVLQATFDQLWQRRLGELLRPLRIRLGEMDGFEVGHDLGGVQIEFFNLVCKELFNESAQLFTTDPTTGLSYFCPGSLQPLYMFELCGLLFALAIYNGITLPLNFPAVYYSILTCAKSDPLEAIADGWPVMKRSLESILKDDITGLEHTFAMEANGLRLTVLPSSVTNESQSERIELPVRDATPIMHHDNRSGVDRLEVESRTVDHLIDIDSISDAWPGWYLFKTSQEPAEITAEKKPAYVRSYTQWLAYGCVQPQWTAFRKGFNHVFGGVDLRFCRHLQLLVEGSTHFDINELRRVTTYDGYEETSKYIQNFWRLVTNWSEAKQKQLLKFVTACERIPPGGTSNLTFKIQRVTPIDMDHLPTSSTCFGTLMLPKYESVAILDKKLSLALKYGAEGFGTG